MGKKSGPKQPEAPDPVATAQAQAAANKEAAISQAYLDRINQYTPQGSITYEVVGTNPDGTPKWQSTQKYSAAEQQKYDQNNQVAISLNGLALDNVDRVQETQAKDFNFNNMTPMVTSVGQNLPAMQYGVQPQAVKNSIGDVGTTSTLPFGLGGEVKDANAGIGDGIQRQLDYSGLSQLPGIGDFAGQAKTVANSVYDQAASRLDPQFQQGQSDLEAKLAAQGISNNSDAYRREADNFGRTKNDAYNQANYSAIQAGANEQSRLFGLALNARQQGQSEADAQGAFTNTAQAQNYSQQQQLYDQWNQAQQQRYTQGQTTTGFNNEVQNQNYTQALGIADLFNNANNQAFNQQQASVGVNNSARAQAFNEQGANADLANSARQQQISEATYLRNLPLNDIAALLGTGTPVAQPQFADVAQVGVAAPDYMGFVANNYNQAMSAYQAKLAQSGGIGGSLFGLAGSVAGAAISDMRFKDSIKHVATLANGLALYTFRYLGSKAKSFGVMAQEVAQRIPEAVGTYPDGIMYVDYKKVMA